MEEDQQFERVGPMNEIFAIAGGTWRRVLRMRVVYFLVICVFILIGSAVNYDVLSMNQHKSLMIDISLVLNTIAAVLVVISITFEIPKELREGVASTLLAKPLGRTQYLIGKLVGTIVTGVVVTLMITIGFFLIFNLAFEQDLAMSAFQAHLLITASIIPMGAIAVLFSVFLPEMITPIITAVVIWFSFSTGHLVKDIPIIYGGILPDLNLYNFKAYAVYGDRIGWSYFLLAVCWGIIYSVFAISLASLIFSNKDIK
jgi:ABC-type transport system involved in multi-copper enzyme maturation permease subunit